MELLALLDQPDHRPGLVAQVLGGLGEVQQPPQRRRVHAVGSGTQHPELQVVPHLVEALLKVADLGGQPTVSQHQRAVGNADGGLREVLHLDQHVDGTVQVGQHLTLVEARRLPNRGSGQLTQPGDSVRRAVQEQHVTGHQHGVAVHVGDPLPSPPHGHDPHAGLNGQLQGRQRPVRHVRAVTDQYPVRHLLGV